MGFRQRIFRAEKNRKVMERKTFSKAPIYAKNAYNQAGNAISFSLNSGLVELWLDRVNGSMLGAHNRLKTVLHRVPIDIHIVEI